MDFIDMHTHSNASDGIYTPSELVDYAIKKGLSGISITDHDTVDGIKEAVQRAKQYKNFKLIPGIELSSEHNNEEVHILGYMLDYNMNSLKNILNNLKDQRNTRAIKIINKLKYLDYKITYEDVSKIAKKGVIGRPHIAQALVEKGYAKTKEEAFKNFLVKGALAYVPRQKLTPTDAIDIIKKAKGLVVIAHPGLLKSIDTLYFLIGLGIDGIEVYHSDHTIYQSSMYFKIAKENNLIITGGSDFHYPPDKNNYHGDLGSIKVPLKYVEILLNRGDYNI